MHRCLQVGSALEHLAVHGPGGGAPPGAGVRLFNSIMDALPAVVDVGGDVERMAALRRSTTEVHVIRCRQIKHLWVCALVFLHHLCAPLIAQGAARARKRRARRAAQKVAGGVFYDENDFAEHEEESNIGDFHVRWEDLADALIALPLGLNVEDVKKILLLTDSTGSGHCSLRKFERTFLGLGAIIGRARVSFKKR